MSHILEAAIREQPDDDLVRRAYADWLEENGELDRSRFVRVQLDHATEPPRSPRAGELDAETNALLAEHEREWLGEWADILVRWSFRRGLLDSVTLTPDDFLDHGQDLLAEHPVREVRFVGDQGGPANGELAEEIVESKQFARVRALNLGGATDEAKQTWCRAITAANDLKRLEELDLSSDYRESASFREGNVLRDLCQCEHLRTLRKLDLSSPMAWDALSDDALSLLIGAPFFHRLESLSLGGWRITDEGLRELIRGRGLPELVELDLGWCERLGRNGIEALLQTKKLPKLSTLSLGGDLDVSALARSGLLGQLECLELCTLADSNARTFPTEDWLALAMSPQVAKLRRLRLMSGILTEDGCRALLQTPGPLNLHALVIMGQPHDAAFAPIIASSPALRSLTAMELIRCGFSADSAAELAKAPFLGKLRQFCVAGNPIRAKGLQELLRSPLAGGNLADVHFHHCELPVGVMRRLLGWSGLANVTRLEVGNNVIDGPAMAALLKSPCAKRLVTLHLTGTDVNDDALAALVANAPRRLREVLVDGRANSATVSALREKFGTRLTVETR